MATDIRVTRRVRAEAWARVSCALDTKRHSKGSRVDSQPRDLDWLSRESRPRINVARCAGWVAHAMEQAEVGTIIRPRARYVGIVPARAERRWGPDQ